MVMTARERGQRVVNYIGSRIERAGLGMWALESSKEIREALEPLTKESGRPLYNKKYPLTLPVVITYEDNDDIANDSLKDAPIKKKNEITHDNKDKDIICGNVLTLLYAERNMDTGENILGMKEEDKTPILIIMTVSPDNQSADISAGVEKTFKFLDFSVNHYKNSKFVYDGSSPRRNINNWALLSGSGIPFSTQGTTKINGVDVYGIILKAYKNATVYDGDELMYLKCRRIFAENPRTYDRNHGVNVKQLKVQKLNDTSWTSSKCRVNPYEFGILEIYMELDTTRNENDEPKNIFTLWVLSTGGQDRMTHEKPHEWPEIARWSDEYKSQVLYVSKGTWKLKNLHPNFKWN